MATKLKKLPLNGENGSISKIDAIKELLFGDNIQAYDSEFEALKADILSKKKELEHLLDGVKSEILQKIDSIDTDVNIRITNLEDALNDKIEASNATNVNRKLLSDLFIKLGERLGE